MIGEYRKRIIKNLTRKYILALLLLSALTVFSFIFFLYSIRTTDKDGYMINLSGKARFYVQRVALAGLQYVCDTNSQKRSVLLTTLKNRITEMEDAHNILTHDTVSITSKYHSPEIDSIYFNAPVFLDKKTNMFLSEAHLLANSNEVELTMNNRHLQYLLNSCNDLLASLNLVVYQYQKENEDEIHGFYYENTLTSVSLVLSYLIVGFFIFRPMTKEINRTLIDLEYKEEELQQSNEKHIAAIIDAQEQERQRIATDLHDGLIQTLATLSYRFDVAGKMKDDTYFHETKLMIGNVINETRNIAHSILPPILKQFGILPALRSLAEQIKNQGNINVVFQTYEFSGRLNEKLELALYRIVQEAISNTIRYAEAKNIKIQLIRHPNSLVLIIEDDGKGFDVSKSPDANGMGLFNIQERAKVFNGNAIINSSPDMGTEIMVEIPLSDNLNTA